MKKLALLFLLLLTSAAFALGNDVPRGWTKVGKVDGLLGDDWYTKRTSNTLSYGRMKDLVYIDEVVSGLEQSYQVNRGFLGLTPPQSLEFYFCPMEEPAHMQPKFQARLRGASRFAGVALSGTNICLINLGNARFARPYAPWEISETARHEMNHLFAFQLKGRDRLNSWGWLYEALAETVENTVKPASTQLNASSMKSYMRGYKAVDASWANLVNERNADDQEQYRDYEKLLVSIVFYMQEKFGRDAVAKLMANCRGRDLEDALAATFGTGAKGLEEGWKQFYGIR